jgi:general L-amino acid transport system permease protein
MHGACWAIIDARFYQFMYGFYPTEEVWRVNLTFLLLPLALIGIFFDKLPYRKFFIYFTFIFPFIAYYLLYGGPTLTQVGTNKWGGLLVTLFLGVTGIGLAFPLSILLALGRRSQMPIISSLCVIFIEFIRGVPLITLLFTANVMLPLFLPEGISPDNLLRALVAVTLFQSAYMAEAIRGGLQAIPRGQVEAARAMGLTYWQSTRKIILPQALRISIPPIVNTSIGLFKDTSLVLIIGLFDLLGIGRAALADMSWIKLYYEVYVFVSLVFFIFCFAMSRYSLYLEKKLKTDNSQ